MKKILLLLPLSLLTLNACSTKEVTTNTSLSSQSSNSTAQSTTNHTLTTNTTNQMQTQTEAVEQSTIESSPSTNWTSIDEAILFYEMAYNNTANEISQNITWENCDRSAWSLIKQEGNRIVLHWANVGGAGGSYDEFIKGPEETTLTNYDGNASYPDAPSMRYTIRNSDGLVTETETLWKTN